MDTLRKCISQTSGTTVGRPRSVELAAVLDLADIVSRVLWIWSLDRTPERAPGNTWWRSVPLLRPPYSLIHAITWVLFQETQGRARK